MKLFIKAFIIVSLFLMISTVTFAEIKTYTHTVKQTFGGSQSPDDARVAAIAKAKRKVLEQAGTYLESLTVVQDGAVAKDEILALAAGVLKALIVSKKNYHTEDAFGIIVVAKVDIDTSILEKRVKRLLQDRTLLGKYKESQEREKKLLTKIQKLEEQNRKLHALSFQGKKQEKDELKRQFRDLTQSLTAIEWLQKGLGLYKDGKYTDIRQALYYFNQAIRFDPGFTLAYLNRGAIFHGLGQPQRAIEDYSQVIRLNPDFVGFVFLAYLARGIEYYELSQPQRAIEDFNQAIDLA
jgi:tetratricopeptide (TPR) repeat protein